MWLAIVCLVVLVSVFRNDDEPNAVSYDLGNPEPNGAKALALLVNRFGGEIEQRDALRSSDDVALVFVDSLTEEQSAGVERWVRSGGTLVVGDPGSSLAPTSAAGTDVRQPGELVPNCSLSYADGVERIAPDPDRDYQVFEDDSDESAVHCFAGRGGSFLASTRIGLGTVVQLGTPNIFTNEQIGKVDNAVLALNLLRTNGNDNVVVLQRSAATIAGGDKTLSDLIPDGVRGLLAQFAVALLVFGIWRSRRLGAPVAEDQQVEIPASVIVEAVGNLLQNANQSAGAAATLRTDLRRSLSELLGTNTDVDPGVLAQLVADRTGIPEGRLLAVLLDGPVPTGEALLHLSQAIEDVYQEVAHAR